MIAGLSNAAEDPPQRRPLLERTARQPFETPAGDLRPRAGHVGRPAAERPAEYTLDGLIAGSPALKRLTELSAALALPTGARSSAKALDDLFQLIERARSNLAATLNTGLDDAETRELLTTRDMNRAVQLVRKGLDARIGLTTVAE